MAIPHHVDPSFRVMDVVEEIERTSEGKVRRLRDAESGALLTEHCLDGRPVDAYDGPRRKDALQWVFQWGCWFWRM